MCRPVEVTLPTWIEVTQNMLAEQEIVKEAWRFLLSQDVPREDQRYNNGYPQDPDTPGHARPLGLPAK